jgi:hypothetical protein
VLDEVLENRGVGTLGKRRIAHGASNRGPRGLDLAVAIELREMGVRSGDPAANPDAVLRDQYAIPRSA